MPKPRILPETEESVYQAWQPNLGRFDVRWASELPPFGKVVSNRNYDKDLDLYSQSDIDNKYLIA